MYINPSWRILTVGDGDLSFSYSLLTHYKPTKLTATVYDKTQTLVNKYRQQYLTQLNALNAEVLTGFDVTNPTTWQDLNKQSYDAVIFQFPLLPAFTSPTAYQELIQKDISVNTLHRDLLRKYLLNCFQHFLDPNGALLAFITSKNVSPYKQWNIERAITLKTNIRYLGSMPFEIKDFPFYQIRNVEKDDFVKETLGTSYVYSTSESCELDSMIEPYRYPAEGSLNFENEHACSLCQSGRFYSKDDQVRHLNSARHQEMQKYETQWLNYLQQS